MNKEFTSQMAYMVVPVLAALAAYAFLGDMNTFANMWNDFKTVDVSNAWMWFTKAKVVLVMPTV